MLLMDYTQPLPESPDDCPWDILKASPITVEIVPPAEAVPQGEPVTLKAILHNNTVIEQIVYIGSVAWNMSLDRATNLRPTSAVHQRRLEDFVTIPAQGTHTVTLTYATIGQHAKRFTPGEHSFTMSYSNSSGQWYGDRGKRGTVDAWEGHLYLTPQTFRMGE